MFTGDPMYSGWPTSRGEFKIASHTRSALYRVKVFEICHWRSSRGKQHSRFRWRGYLSIVPLPVQKSTFLLRIPMHSSNHKLRVKLQPYPVRGCVIIFIIFFYYLQKAKRLIQERQSLEFYSILQGK